MATLKKALAEAEDKAAKERAVVVLRLTVERGVGMERQGISYGEGVHTGFTSSGPSRRK